ncbi:hypothetical protein [Flavobacterium sp. CAU 1735]|uniref:hypothetical protein n=1 Tax=Flavobacterium sp. CAU 1735 TaxID=3140361 RepID=UPI00326182B4
MFAKKRKTTLIMIKKIFLAVLCIAAIGCSSDDSASGDNGNAGNGTPKYRIKKITEFRYYNSQIFDTSIIYFSYDEDTGELDKITDFGDKLVGRFGYAGNKIERFYIADNHVFGLGSSATVGYSGDNLVHMYSTTGNRITALSYENDVLKTIKITSGNATSLQELTFDQNGNRIEKLTSALGQTNKIKSRYFYDDKKNPLSDMNPYLKYMLNYRSMDMHSKNGVTKEEQYANETSTEPIETIYYEMQYNEGGFPTEIIKTFASTSTQFTKTIIEYKKIQ